MTPERYQKRKSELIELLGGECKKCGSTDRLEFDHVDPKNKSFTIMDRWYVELEILITELQKCQLLCFTCHRKKSFAVEHGGGVYGKKNCTCDLCKARRKEYMKMYKLYGPAVNWPKQ